MVLLRSLLGEVLRRHRQAQSRTLREVSAAARISLGYLSEVERGCKEASSELLSAICAALEVPLSDVLREVGEEMAGTERVSARTAGVTPEPEPMATVAALERVRVEAGQVVAAA